MSDPHLRAKRLIVCADDYAFTAGVSRSIRELLAARRISATSVMAGMPGWPEAAEPLRAVAGNADIGLHVTLTDQKPLGAMPTFAPDGRCPPMSAVHKAGVLRRLPLAEIRAEIHRQAERFITVWGKSPAHIDGHHHVQQLPGIRNLIVELAASMSPRPWVRAADDPLMLVAQRGVAVPKALVIGAFGAAVKRRAARAGVPTNDGFSGAYDIVGDARPVADLFRRFIVGARENTLIMCHPGYGDAELAKLDIMVEARDREHAFLMSDAWPRMLADAGLDLGALRRL